MEKIVDDDDEFGDLYADVEVQAINAIMQSTTTPEVNEVNEENAIYEEECESENDEDDLNIVLNDDYENDKFEENEVKQNSNGSENSTGEKNVYKNTRPPQAAYSNHHKADGSSCAHSYSAAQNGQTFSLPWSRNILDINIDIFEKKPWRHPSADLTDYFNFGFDEDSWKQYCNLLDKHREQAERVVKESDYKPSKNSKPKGRVIEVEESITERQPSTDVGRSQDRDSGVVIQITLQDSMEDFINSPKGQCRASENRDAGEDGRDFLTSISEDELPSLEGTEGGSGSATNGRNTPVQECVSMDSDNYENCDFSDAEEHDHQEGANCDVDQTLGAIESSHDANTSSEGDISDPRKFVMLQEPLHGEGGEHSPGSSCSQSHGEASGDGALLDFERSRDHHVRSLPNSESALREKGTIDYKPLKFPKTHHIRTKPGGSKYFTRGRSVQRDLPHDRTRPGRMSETNPAHLQDEDSRTSDARIVYERCNSTAIQHRKDSRHAFDSHEKEDTSHFNGAERFYSDAVRLSDYPRRVSYTKNRETECQLKRRFEKSWCGSRSTKSKLDPLELSISRDDELWERDRPHSGSRLTVQDMDNVAIHESEQLIDKNTPYLDDEKASPQMWKPNQLKSNKRMRTDDLVTECNYIYDIMEETDNRYRPYNTDTDILEDGCHVNLTYFRRETKSHIKGKRRDNSPRYGLNNICSMDLKNEEGRFDGYRPPSFRLYREPCTASRKWQSPSLPRGNRRRIFSGTGRCQDGGRFANLTNSISANQTIKYPGNQDSFERRKEYQQSEGLRCVEDENSSWFQQNILDAERISCSFKRTPTDRRFESFDSEHGPNLVGKLLDGRHMDQERYKLMREGNNASQFGQGSKFFHRDNHQRRFSRWRGSVDPGLVVGKRESSGRWSKAGGVEGIYEPHLRKTLKTRDLASDSNENGIERLDRFADAQQEESPDIEEGQIISEEMNKKTIKGRITYSGKLQTREMKSLDNNKKVEGQDNPKILEIMAKMEKRRERFKQSIALNNESKVVSKPSVDLFAGTTEAMQPRPARKRRWVGSETN